ncbi:HIRAN domain-containing protein [Agrobacterium tumefaciens]|uniref:HIRAN domain-containing protein n=1 Tax=Agrobacterium tumefaciens TaxID=358 RepID=UPI0021CF36A4|nr:HIRAN domain-containing protein [Agrobacterium tumefaciens]UXS01079.1 restriction endonuclease [Agrobacterium tumefaciens]
MAKLIQADNLFVFGYTKGARLSENFLPFGSMHDLDSLYVSHELFPMFANRVMNEKRPEYQQYMRWADLSPSTSDPIGLMARIGGVRATDGLQVLPVPEPGADGNYKSVFFVHGISHLSLSSQQAVSTLKKGDQLYPLLDIHNPIDANAVCLRSGDPASLVGYCPRYLAPDMKSLADSVGANMKFSVRAVNQDAPAQFRLLCEVTCNWPEGFVPCDTEEHQLNRSIKINELIKLVDQSERAHSPARTSWPQARSMM